MKNSCLLLLTLITANAAFASIDLTPVPGERMLDGIKFHQLIFSDSGHKITYEQPLGWSYSGGGARIKFTPAAFTQAYAEIEQTPLPSPQNFDEPTMKALQDQALGNVPPNSQDAAIVTAEKNPLMINRHETFEVTVSYHAYGQDYTMSVLYMNLPDTQLKFRCVARKTDFEKVHKAFRGSLYSWQWL